MIKLIFYALIFSLGFSQNSNQILFLTKTNQIPAAINLYQNIYKDNYDFEILQNMALMILDMGAKSSNIQIKQLAMYGSGLAISSKALNILKKGLFSSDMYTQLIALHFICFLQEDIENDLLIQAMSSDFLQTRIEAAYQMAMKKHPCAFGQIESLMQRLPPVLKPFFPQFFVLIGSFDATRVLKSMLYDPDPNVRIQTILGLANKQRDDLLYIFRKKIKNASVSEQEALLYALGTLKDSYSIEEIKKYTTSSIENVKIAAILALKELKESSLTKQIFHCALNGNLFAIYALAKIEDSQELLYTIISGNSQEKLNATIALLLKRDKRCLKPLIEILINDIKIQPIYSAGKSLIAYQVINRQKDIDQNLSISIKEYLLKEALELDEDSFLSLAEAIYEAEKKELIPVASNLLGNLNTEKAINILKKYSQKTGSSLIRNYCNLVLYKIGETNAFAPLKAWVLNNIHIPISLNPLSEDKMIFDKNQYVLSYQETSRLLIEIFSVLAEKHDLKAIDLFLEALKITSEKNLYLLSGLLIHATD